MEAECEQVHGGGGGEEEEAGADEVMLWSFQEAVERQTLPIGASACGATAVVDVLKALGVDVAPEEADRCVQTRLRRNESPLPDYLLPRSEAEPLCIGRTKESRSAALYFTPPCDASARHKGRGGRQQHAAGRFTKHQPR
ncbi:uncharacterized protein PEZ65_022985 [Lycodopsis pacificus]